MHVPPSQDISVVCLSVLHTELSREPLIASASLLYSLTRLISLLVGRQKVSEGSEIKLPFSLMVYKREVSDSINAPFSWMVCRCEVSEIQCELI